jgi:hypothetical protein
LFDGVVIATSDNPVIGMLIFPDPSKETPAMLLAVCNLVAVPAFPVIVVTDVRYPAEA